MIRYKRIPGMPQHDVVGALRREAKTLFLYMNRNHNVYGIMIEGWPGWIRLTDIEVIEPQEAHNHEH